MYSNIITSNFLNIAKIDSMLKRLVYKAIILSVLFVCHSYHTQAQDKKVQQNLYTGFLFQNTCDLYENGVSILYSPVWQNDRLFLGLDYITNRLGSDISFLKSSIKSDNYVFSALYLFLKNDRFRPFTKLNIGMNYVNLKLTETLSDSKSYSLLSLEVGGIYKTKEIPFMASLSIGYSFMRRDGDPRSFFRLGVYYDILKLF